MACSSPNVAFGSSGSMTSASLGRPLRLPAEAFVAHADLVRAGGATLELWMSTDRPPWAAA